MIPYSGAAAIVRPLSPLPPIILQFGSFMSEREPTDRPAICVRVFLVETTARTLAPQQLSSLCTKADPNTPSDRRGIHIVGRAGSTGLKIRFDVFQARKVLDSYKLGPGHRYPLQDFLSVRSGGRERR